MPKPYSPNKYQLGEGLFFDHNQIWAVDIHGQKIIKIHHPEIFEYHFPHPTPSCIIPITSGEEYLVASGQSLYRWNQNKTTELYQLKNVDPKVRFNDGKCDARGTLWIGTLDQAGRTGLGGLYRLMTNPSYKLEKILNADLSNGLGWNTDSTQFYYIDTPTRSLQVFNYSLFNSQIGSKIRQINLSIPKIPKAVPDGLTVDTQDHVWIAIWDGYQIIRLNPDQDQPKIETFPIDSQQPTTVVIDNQQHLYITTANDHIYRMELTNPVNNQPCHRFKLK